MFFSHFLHVHLQLNINKFIQVSLFMFFLRLFFIFIFGLSEEECLSPTPFIVPILSLLSLKTKPNHNKSLLLFFLSLFFLSFSDFLPYVMDKYKCKLCYRSFNNGRALGGHMRSHMMNLLVTKQEDSSRMIQLSFEGESASSSSSEDDDDEKSLSYGLRENPKRSIRLVDQDFSFPPVDTSSVILQDIESETESSKNNPTRKRSKRVWKIRHFDQKYYDESSSMKKVKFFNKNDSSVVDHEPGSSVSDTSEENVAFCLMKLSRDKWDRQNEQYNEEAEEEIDYDDDPEEDEDEEDEEIERSLEESDESQELIKLSKSNNKVRKGKYKCETCNKVFKSYQALGGHRASHKKIKTNITIEESSREFDVVEKKVHECPVCFRVFNSGQALGGHKRTHVMHGSTTSTTIPIFSTKKVGKSVIDLNLPAPIDDDEVSQIENSAVSDAEFVKTH